MCSQVFNSTLLTPVNLEKKIGDVLQCQQASTIIETQDIAEAFFRLRLSPAAKNIVFLMDITEDVRLTADVTPGNRLVAVSFDVSGMEVSQTPLLLALASGDLDLEAVFKHLIDSCPPKINLKPSSKSCCLPWRLSGQSGGQTVCAVCRRRPLRSQPAGLWDLQLRQTSCE